VFGTINGTTPNLVVSERNQNGEICYKHAFNTQACEQLNAWLGGLGTILKRMSPRNFDWFLHTVLFYHTRHVKKQSKSQDESDDDTDDSID
jgi:hypothetical protein